MGSLFFVIQCWLLTSLIVFAMQFEYKGESVESHLLSAIRSGSLRQWTEEMKQFGKIVYEEYSKSDELASVSKSLEKLQKMKKEYAEDEESDSEDLSQERAEEDKTLPIDVAEY